MSAMGLSSATFMYGGVSSKAEDANLHTGRYETAVITLFFEHDEIS
jgi:hypothetical protein